MPRPGGEGTGPESQRGTRDGPAGAWRFTVRAVLPGPARRPFVRIILGGRQAEVTAGNGGSREAALHPRAQSPRRGQTLSSVACGPPGAPPAVSQPRVPGLAECPLGAFRPQQGTKQSPATFLELKVFEGTQRRKWPGWVAEGPRRGGRRVSLRDGHSWSFWSIRGLWQKRKVKGSMRSLCVLIRVSSVFSQKQKQRLGLLLLTARWTLPSSLNVTTAGSGLRGPWGALGFRRGHSGGQIAPSGGTTCLGSGSEKPLGAENAGMEVCRRAFGGTGCLLGLGRDGGARELRLASTPAACVSQFDVGLGGARSPHIWVPPLWAKPRDS